MEGHSNVRDFEYLISFQMTSQLFLLYFHFFPLPTPHIKTGKQSIMILSYTLRAIILYQRILNLGLQILHCRLMFIKVPAYYFTSFYHFSEENTHT